MIGSYIISVKRIIRAPFTIKGFIKRPWVHSIWALAAVVIVVFGVVGSVFTATGVRCYRSYLLSAGLRLCLQGP